MWIVFDLDDTLIDTSGSITPIALKRAFSAIKERGLNQDLEVAYRDLLRLNQQSASSQSAIDSFGQLYGLCQREVDFGKKALSHLDCYKNAKLVPQATQVLQTLHAANHRFALVTRGEKSIQREKMTRAGLDPELFVKSYFCPNQSKKHFYEKISIEFALSPGAICVCGDRIHFDLTPAKELGYHTIHIKWGRGLGNTGLKRDVDYTISELGELASVIEKIDKPALL